MLIVYLPNALKYINKKTYFINFYRIGLGEIKQE